LLYVGHTGVSIDDGKFIYGFNPDIGADPMWRAMERLRNGDALPGTVRDDIHVFRAATTLGLKILTLRVLLPSPHFRTFQRDLGSERRRSMYSYGFPNGDGDCNCTTWLERMGLPLLSGSMDEFTSLPGFANYPTRRFGECV
jgi:hypothetical protein